MQRDKTYPDRRVMLKIKLHSLADEARYIRKIEQKHRDITQLNSMHQHRTRDLRSEARHTHLAYGFIRGMHWYEMEANWAEQDKQHQPNWEYIQRMLDKYGPKGAKLVKDSDGSYSLIPKEVAVAA